MQMSSYGYIMTWMLWYKHILFKNSLLFSKQGFFSAWNQNIFKIWFIIPEKSSSFWLKAPKNLVITVRNLRMGLWLGIWWSGSKDLFSQFGWVKRVAHFQGLFLEKWILWKSSILKRFIFSSPWLWQFDKRQDPPDRLGNSRNAILDREFKFFDFGKGLRNPWMLQMLPSYQPFIHLLTPPMSLLRYFFSL